MLRDGFVTESGIPSLASIRLSKDMLLKADSLVNIPP